MTTLDDRGNVVDKREVDLTPFFSVSNPLMQNTWKPRGWYTLLEINLNWYGTRCKIFMETPGMTSPVIKSPYSSVVNKKVAALTRMEREAFRVELRSFMFFDR